MCTRSPAPAVPLLPALLDGHRLGRVPELAGRLDMIAAPRDEPAGHRVLGEVRVGPLVDGVGSPVAPVLEELGCGPRVVDLVEVHLVRLGEAERPKPERRQDQDEDQPRIEAVEAAALFADQRPGTVRTDRERRAADRRSSP